MQTQSQACCSRPPVTLSGGYDYNIKGKYLIYNNMKTYVTGSSTAKRGIFLCYDVFGLYIQALKGADILASDYEQYPDGAGEFKVFMPDFWGDSPQDLSLFPPKTPAQTKKIVDFFITGPGNIEKSQPLIMPLFEAIKMKHPEIESWAIMGFCWGGKIAALFSQSGTPFKASAQCHPSLLDVNDASRVSIPMVMLPSMDEEAEVQQLWGRKLLEASPSSYHETFADQPHGWMTSRADFNNLHAYEEYLRGYRIVRTFFSEHL